jgi:hypothetical protein
VIRAAVALLLCAAGACTVDDGFLETERFPCSVAADCGERWGCVRAAPYASDFCAPDCEESCDGVCVVQGASTLCLAGCRIRDDGTTTPCASDDLACVRVSAESDEGVCYPVDTCSEGGPTCPAGDLCLSTLAEAFGAGTGGLRTDNLYCVPAPDAPLPGEPDPCPARSFHSRTILPAATFQLCLPLCDAFDTRCPPSFGCLRQIPLDVGAICLPGVFGIPCDDDTNCLRGRCMDTGDAGRFCTTSCEEAERIGLGCENISLLLNAVGLRYRLECDPDANGGNAGGLCAPRYEIGFACTEPDSEAFACADGLSCMQPEGFTAPFCTRPCSTNADCNTAGRSQGNFCEPTRGVCFVQGFGGDPCLTGEWCISGQCVDNMCTAPT